MRRRLQAAPTRRSAAALLLAAPLLAAPMQPAAGYDAEAGRALADKVCAACHGPAGNSQIATIPSLAGQRERYIILALFQFRAGHRQSEQMAPFAAKLSDDDLGNLAAYYSAQQPAPPAAAGDPEKSAAAQRLADALHCTQCHGPKLAGQDHIPRLAGQHAEYLMEQLRGFRAATRGDIDGSMSSAAQALSDADIDLLAGYIAGLAPQ